MHLDTEVLPTSSTTAVVPPQRCSAFFFSLIASDFTLWTKKKIFWTVSDSVWDWNTPLCIFSAYQVDCIAGPAHITHYHSSPAPSCTTCARHPKHLITSAVHWQDTPPVVSLIPLLSVPHRPVVHSDDDVPIPAFTCSLHLWRILKYKGDKLLGFIMGQFNIQIFSVCLRPRLKFSALHCCHCLHFLYRCGLRLTVCVSIECFKNWPLHPLCSCRGRSTVPPVHCCLSFETIAEWPPLLLQSVM